MRILSLITGLIFSFAAFAQDKEKINEQLLEAINNKNIQQVIDACHNGADFLKFTDEQHRQLGQNLDNYFNAYNEIEDAKTRIAFDRFNMFLYEQNDTLQAVLLAKLAKSHHALCDYSSAERLYLEALNRFKQLFGEQHSHYSVTLCNLASVYQDVGDYAKAESLLLRSLQIDKSIHGEQHPDYATNLNNLASLYIDLGDYCAAEPLLQEALKIRGQVLGEQHPDYVSNLSNLAVLYTEIGDYTIAESLLQKALKICKQVQGEHSIDYAIKLSNLASLYQEMGSYTIVGKYLLDAQSIFKQVLGERHPYYAMNLNSLAVVYQAIGEFSIAEQLIQDALQIQKQVLGERHPDYASSLDNLGAFYKEIGDYAKAEQLLHEALLIRKQVLGERHLDYAQSLNSLAILNYELGDYESAKMLLHEAIHIRKQKLGELHPIYAQNLNNLAVLYQETGEYVIAESLLKEALQIIKKRVLGELHPVYATSLNNLASLFQEMGCYETAKQFYYETIRIRKQIFGDQHPDYVQSLNNLALLLYQDFGDYTTAESLLIQGKRIHEQLYGEKHPRYITSLNNLASLYRDWSNYKSAAPLYLQSMQLTTNRLVADFNFMSERQRERYWQSNELEFCSSYPFFAYLYRTQKDTISSFAYDNELFLKGLLLNAMQQVKKNILASNDSVLIGKYNQLKLTKERIMFLQQQPKDKQLGLDSLQTLAESLDKELVLMSKEYRRSRENMNVKWEQVRDKLSEDEIAIEFSSFRVQEDNVWITKIVALLLRKDCQYPEYIVLCNEDDIIPLLDEDAGKTYGYIYNGADLYAKLWQSLSNHIKAGNTVYFSPSGILYKINLSALPVNDRETVGDKYNLVRLSSTRELVLRHESIKCDKVVLYGGLVYEVEAKDMLQASAKYEKHELMAYRSLPKDSVRTEATYLGGTEKEINQIANTLSNYKISATTYSGFEGNEESFKALSGQKYKILHIATHGFFFNNEKAQDKRMFENLKDNQLEKPYIDPLLRCGLLLSGAYKAWTGHRDQLPEGVQDGILTAKEISVMDLRDADLVVLSACETGLGEVNSDGVFGLQRGFKLAGVKSLLMSLWKVKDEATQILMTEFYKHFLDGESKIESLKKAQQYVKSQSGYEDPEYWAGFILLDAID